MAPLPTRTLRIPAVLMRGGTSRGLVFKREDLPADPRLRDLIFLAALGSPDVRQLDGVGAGDSHTSKVAVVNRSEAPEADVDFLFGEVAIREPRVDYAGNSGNIISALGVFAVEEGWVEARAPETLVRINNLNTGKAIELLVPVAAGQAALDGDFAIDGVPGVGPRIDMRFPDPGGALTGRLLADGNAVSSMDVPGVGRVRASLVDAANPVVFLEGRAFGVEPTTPPAALNADAALLERLQAARALAAVRFGLVERVEQAWRYSAMIPFLVLLFPPSDYPSLSDAERTVRSCEMDVCARVLSLNMVHKAINVTVSVALTAAALVPGTLVHELSAGAAAHGELRIGHPSGVVRTHGAARHVGRDLGIDWVRLGRTARRIMQGEVLVQPYKLRWLAALVGAERSDS